MWRSGSFLVVVFPIILSVAKFVPVFFPLYSVLVTLFFISAALSYSTSELPASSSDILLYWLSESTKLCRTDCVVTADCCFIICSCSLISRNHGCFRACEAVIRLSGLYTSSFTIKSLTSSEAFCSNFKIPVPSFLGKSNSMCVAYF